MLRLIHESLSLGFWDLELLIYVIVPLRVIFTLSKDYLKFSFHNDSCEFPPCNPNVSIGLGVIIQVKILKKTREERCLLNF